VIAYSRWLTSVLCAVLLALCLSGAGADGDKLAGAPSSRSEAQRVSLSEVLTLTPHLALPPDCDPDHPLVDVVRKTWAGEFGPQPEWRLSLLIQGLRNGPRVARMTAYSSNCPDGGGPHTRWGTRVRRGICAADPRYWGPGSVIWVDEPLYQTLVVEDTGSAVGGRDRFDICVGDSAGEASRFGVQHLTYVPLYVAPLRRNWGSKPDDWAPPVAPVQQVLKCRRTPQGAILQVQLRPAEDTG
jgi:3D (Asp-Asp-Asp) domain-containing protein